MIELELFNPPAVEVDLSDAMQGPAGPPGNQQVAPASTLIGNATGAPANPTGLTVEQVKALLQYVAMEDLQAALPTPIKIEAGRTFVVPSNIQMPFFFPIEINGTLQVDGVLYQV